MINLSVIIPAYNEEQRIIPTIQKFHAFLLKKTISFEIIIVDDGSADKTVEVVAALQQQLPQLSVLALPVNRGKGHAVKQGMLMATGDVRMFSDADGSTPVEELDKLLEVLLQGQADIAIGSRYLEDSEVVKPQPKLRIIWSRMVNRLVQKLLLPGVLDTHCGFKMFTADAALKIFSACTIDGWSFDLEVLAIARKLQLRTKEIPVKWANDERSKGKIRHLPRELYSFYKISMLKV